MKPIKIFFIAVAVIACLLFFFPINLFDGEIVYKNGLQNIVEKAPLSLSYFIGFGYDPEDMKNIESFRLLPTGYMIAFLFLFGFPALLAYRIHLGRLKKKK